MLLIMMLKSSSKDILEPSLCLTTSAKSVDSTLCDSLREMREGRKEVSEKD